MNKHPRPSPLALVPRSRFPGLQRTHPHVLPQNNRPGAWLDSKERKSLRRATTTRFTTVFALPELWNDWDTVLFTAQYGAVSDDIRLVRRVERWTPGDLRVFAADDVERFLHRFTGAFPDGPRLAEIVDVVRRSAGDGLISVEDKAARAVAVAVYEGMDIPDGSVHDMTSEELQQLRANDLALSVLLLASPDRPGDPAGTSLRKAVMLARQSACRGPGGHIGARILGRQHHAELMRFLKVGTDAERSAVSEGTAPGVGAVWAQNLATFEIVDLLHGG